MTDNLIRQVPPPPSDDEIPHYAEEYLVHWGTCPSMVEVLAHVRGKSKEPGKIQLHLNQCPRCAVWEQRFREAEPNEAPIVAEGGETKSSLCGHSRLVGDRMGGIRGEEVEQTGRDMPNDLVDDTTHSALFDLLLSDPADKAAVEKFILRYGPLIYRWARESGLNAFDAEDITQTVLLKLLKRFAERKYRYPPGEKGFLHYLRTVTRNAVCDYCRHRAKAGRAGNEKTQELLDNLEAAEDLSRCLEAEHAREKVENALIVVQRSQSADRVAAFRLMHLEGLSAEEAAARLGIRRSAVYKASSEIRLLVEAVIRAQVDE